MKTELLAPALMSLPFMAVLSACGDDVVGADFEEQCGIEAPVQVLPLEQNEFVDTMKLSKFGENYVIGIRTFEEPISNALSTMADQFDDQQTRAHVVLANECGEGEPTVIAEDYDAVIPPEFEGGPWLGCHHITGALALLDPTGEHPPLELGSTRHCRANHQTEGAIVVQEASDGDFGPADLVRYEFEGDALVAATTIEPNTYLVWGTSGDGEKLVTALTEDGTLFEINVETGARNDLLFDGVTDYQRHRDGRYIAWTNDGERGDFWPPKSHWFLWDRDTGESRPLGGADWAMLDVWWRKDGFLAFRLPEGASTGVETLETWIYWAGNIDEPVALSGRWELEAATDDGLLVVTPLNSWGQTGTADGIYALDPGSSEPRLLAERSPDVLGGWLEGDRFYFFEALDQNSSYPPSTDFREQLVSVVLDGSDVRVESPNIYQALEFPNGRFATVRGHAHDYYGELVLKGSDGEALIDRDVLVFFARYNGGSSSGAYGERYYDSNQLLYSVLDPQKTRTGIWSATLDL